MAAPLELLSPTDKPALLALSTAEYSAAAKTALASSDFKIHEAGSHEDFGFRFSQISYQVVLIEECFACASASENAALRQLQAMPMNQRRHATVLLIGHSFQTLEAMQAFRQSVHAVINPADLTNLSQIIQKVLSDNTLFLNVYREVQTQLAQGKA